MSITIEPMCESHLDGIMNVEKNSFTIPWSRQSFVDELNNSLAVYFVATDSTEGAIGYIGFWNVAGECDITNIAVLPSFRKSGIGSRLLSEAISYCKKNTLSRLTLEVRITNTPARSLYSKFGFTEIGIRKNYYADTKEDAIIMEKILQPEKENQ